MCKRQSTTASFKLDAVNFNDSILSKMHIFELTIFANTHTYTRTQEKTHYAHQHTDINICTRNTHSGWQCPASPEVNPSGWGNTNVNSFLFLPFCHSFSMEAPYIPHALPSQTVFDFLPFHFGHY